MAVDDEISKDPQSDGIDLPEEQRETGSAQGVVSPLFNTRTLAAGLAGAVITALILGAVVLFLRGDDNAPIQVLLSTQTPSSDSTGAMGPSKELKVYVTGAVVNPGVYTLPPGDRLTDAIDAAGGATTDAQMEAVNLALRVKDEGHYHIPRLGETTTADTTAGFQGNQASGPLTPGICDGLININTATVELLKTLPNIGEVRAAAVVSYRQENGGFKSLEDITNVSGIGPATYEAIRGLATVCDSG